MVHSQLSACGGPTDAVVFSFLLFDDDVWVQATPRCLRPLLLLVLLLQAPVVMLWFPFKHHSS